MLGLSVVAVVQGLGEAVWVMPRQERLCEGGEVCVGWSQCQGVEGRKKEAVVAALRHSQCGFSGSEPLLCCSPSSFSVDGLNVRTGIVGEAFTEPSVTPVSQQEYWSREFGPK